MCLKHDRKNSRAALENVLVRTREALKVNILNMQSECRESDHFNNNPPQTFPNGIVLDIFMAGCEAPACSEVLRSRSSIIRLSKI